MTKLLIFTPSGTVAVSTGQFQYVSVVLDLSHFWWRMLRDLFPATRLWLQMKQCRRQRSMVCKRHTLLRRRRWIAEGAGSPKALARRLTHACNQALALAVLALHACAYYLVFPFLFVRAKWTCIVESGRAKLTAWKLGRAYWTKESRD